MLDAFGFVLVVMFALRLYLPWLIAKAAERRGHDKWMWYLAGLFIGPILLFIGYLIFGRKPPRPSLAERMAAEGEAEEAKAAAAFGNQQ
jgi:hypothetical protein